MIQKSATANKVVLDIKEASKRTVQLVQISIVCCFIIMLINIMQGIYLTASILAFWCLIYTLILVITKKGYYQFAKISVLFFINMLLVISTKAEGLETGAYMFFLPLLFAIPFALEDNKYFNIEIYAYLGFTFVSFFVALFISDDKSTWQIIPEEAVKIKFYINSAFAVGLSGVFSYFSIYFERKYATALMEQKLKAEEATMARSRFLSNMGHELRTPLNGIIGAANLLDKNIALKDQDEYINIVKYCSGHMLQLVNDLLDFNKIDAQKLELHQVEFNLLRLLKSSVLPFDHQFVQKNVSLITELDAELSEVVLADDLRLIQILNNLLSNALKFTEKGHVKLGAKVQEKSESAMTVAFFVEDTGIGIAQEDQQKIFESFEQVYSGTSRKYDGTGLGLSIGLRLLNLMGSKLEVESTEGIGSKFYFSLRFNTVLQTETTPAVQAELIDIAGKRILIAEDNPINMMIAKKMLTSWKAIVTPTVNGLEALNVLKENPDFDLILLDLGMPEMDGYEAIVEIKKLYPAIPVLAFTAALMDNEMNTHLLSIGFDDSILKPFKPEEFLSKIKRFAL